QAVDGRTGGGLLLFQHREQRVQRPVDAEPEQFVLARDVVVDRRLGDPEAVGEVLHAGAFVTALVENPDGDLEQSPEVISGPAPARCALSVALHTSKYRSGPVSGCAGPRRAEVCRPNAPGCPDRRSRPWWTRPRCS